MIVPDKEQEICVGELRKFKKGTVYLLYLIAGGPYQKHFVHQNSASLMQIAAYSCNLLRT